MNHQELVEGLKTLRLFEMAAQYSEMATIAEKESMTYEKFLATLVNSETAARTIRKIERLIKAAKIPSPKILERYDYTGRQGITARSMAKLSTGQFVKESANIVFYGSIGVGKSHLAKGLLLKLCEAGYRCRFFDTHELINNLLAAQKSLEMTRFQKQLDGYDVIVCDELGYTPHDQEGANLFFQMISNRYERRSLIITTNLTFSEWDKVFIDATTTAAAVDRIVHRCQTFNVQGKSWRAEAAEKAVKSSKTS